MRAPFALLLLALLVPNPAQAYFGPDGFDRQDGRGDEQIVFYNYPMNVVGCHDAAIDISSLSVRAQEGVLTATLAVWDLGSRHVTCGGVSVRRDHAAYAIHTTPVVGFGDALALRVEIGPSGVPRGCGEIAFGDGTRSAACVGEMVFDGAFRWTIPVQGRVEVDNGDVRAYDLRAEQVDVHATSAAYVDEPGLYPAVADWTVSYSMRL